MHPYLQTCISSLYLSPYNTSKCMCQYVSFLSLNSSLFIFLLSSSLLLFPAELDVTHIACLHIFAREYNMLHFLQIRFRALINAASPPNTIAFRFAMSCDSHQVHYWFAAVRSWTLLPMFPLVKKDSLAGLAFGAPGHWPSPSMNEYKEEDG